MKRNTTALLCALTLLLAGCGSSKPATTEPEEEKPAATTEPAEEKTEETTATTSSGRGGDGIKADDSGYAYGYIGDKMSDAFFDFTVNSAESAQSYKDYTAAEGNKLVIVDITIHNTFRGSVPMFATDFYVVYDWNSDPVAYADPINSEDAALTYGDMLPNEYSMAINEEVNGLLVYEVPESTKDVTLLFDEYFENEEWGDTYEVDFTVK